MLKYRICKLRLDHQNSRFNVLVLYVDCGYVTGYKFVIFYMIKVIIYAWFKKAIYNHHGRIVCTHNYSYYIRDYIIVIHFIGLWVIILIYYASVNVQLSVQSFYFVYIIMVEI